MAANSGFVTKVDPINFKINGQEFKELTKAMREIDERFGIKDVNDIAFKASKPIYQAAKQLAPVNKDERYIMPKRHFPKYKPGALKKSIGRWRIKRRYGAGVLVGARFGQKRPADRDGWYVHFAHDTHPVKGGKETKQATQFINQAFNTGANQALDILMVEAKKLIHF